MEEEMQTGMTGGRRRQKGALALLVCVCMLLGGCAGSFFPGTGGNPAEENADAAEEGSLSADAGEPNEAEEAAANWIPISEQVLEIGVLLNCGDPYPMVVYETFRDLAGESDVPIVVELHDSWGSYERQQEQVEAVTQRGADLLLVDVADKEKQRELAADLLATGLPVLFFGSVPSKELLEETDSVYIGLTEEEEAELKGFLQRDDFDGSGYRERAWEDGEKLMEAVMENEAAMP